MSCEESERGASRQGQGTIHHPRPRTAGPPTARPHRPSQPGLTPISAAQPARLSARPILMLQLSYLHRALISLLPTLSYTVLIIRSVRPSAPPDCSLLPASKKRLQLAVQPLHVVLALAGSYNGGSAYLCRVVCLSLTSSPMAPDRRECLHCANTRSHIGDLIFRVFRSALLVSYSLGRAPVGLTGSKGQFCQGAPAPWP